MNDATTIREIGEPGDLGWILQAHGELYAKEYGWGMPFEELVAGIVGDFATSRDPAQERGWMAELDGRRVGCVLCVKDEGEHTARLRVLLVDPAGRGHGLGTRLVDECLRFARSAGYERVSLWTQSVLTSARTIYQAAGFELIAEEKHSDFEEALVGQHWALRLSPLE